MSAVPMPSTESQARVLSGEAYRLLSQIMLLGSDRGMFDRVRSMSEDLQLLRPDLPYASCLLAVAEVAAGRAFDAVRRLETCVAEFPGFQLGRALLALSMAESGAKGWQSLLEAVIDDGSDEHAMTLASALLGRGSHQLDPNSCGGPEYGSSPEPGQWDSATGAAQSAGAVPATPDAAFWA